MIKLKETCFACPEQYEAFDGEDQVGYLRLRYGIFKVTCPDYFGVLVYSAATFGNGEFESDERDYHLRFAVAAIQRWQKEKERPTAPDVKYELEGDSHD